MHRRRRSDRPARRRGGAGDSAPAPQRGHGELRRRGGGRLGVTIEGQAEATAGEPVLAELELDHHFFTEDHVATDARVQATGRPREEVTATPPSASYKLGKFVRRHRAGVITAATVTVALMLGIAGTTVGFIRAVAAEKVATKEAHTATRVTDFLVQLFEVSDPDQSKGETITARAPWCWALVST